MSAVALTDARSAPSPTAMARAGSWIRRLLQAGRERWIARRDEHILLQKSEQELKDIGIGRADIHRAVRGELWRAR